MARIQSPPVQPTIKPIPRFLTVRQFAETHQAFPESSLRWLILHAETNGLNRAIRRVGRRVLIAEEDFFAWIEQTNRNRL